MTTDATWIDFRGRDVKRNPAKQDSAPARLAYSVPEAAIMIGVSKSIVWRLISDGKLSSVKIDGRRVVRHSDLLALLSEGA